MTADSEKKSFLELSEEERQQRYNEMKERGKDNPPNQNQPQETTEKPILEPERLSIIADQSIPISEPGKNPEDLNIEEAREFLEKAYGPEKLSVTVGAENAQKPYITETIDRSIPILEKQKTTKKSGNNPEGYISQTIVVGAKKTKEKPPTTKIVDNGVETGSTVNELLVKVGGVEDIEKKERALVVLKDEEVMKRSPKEIVEAFRNLTEDETGEHRYLAKERNEMAYKNLRERGCTILIGKEAIEKAKQDLIKRETKKVEDERYIDAKSRYLNGLSENQLSKKEKKEYIKDGSFDKERYLAATIENLGISNVVFAEMILNQHLEIHNIRRIGLFKTTIKIPSSDGRESVAKTEKEFKEWIEKFIVPKANESVLREAQLRVDQKIINSRKRMLIEKELCAKVIIQQAVEKYEVEKVKLKLKPDLVIENPPKTTEILKSFKNVSDIEKLIKKVNSDIEAGKEQQNEMKESIVKMKKLIKIIQQGKPLTKKQIVSLNKIDSGLQK